MTTPPEIYYLKNGSTFEVRCTYPDKNDPLILEAIVRGMAHIGVFDGIFDDNEVEKRVKNMDSQKLPSKS